MGTDSGALFWGSNILTHFCSKGKERVPPTLGPEGGAFSDPEDGGGAGQHRCPSPFAGTPCPQEKEGECPHPDTSRGRKGQHGAWAPPQRSWGPCASLPVSPAGSEGPAPRRWGLFGGADFTPLPLWPWRFGNTPPAPVRRVGEAAEQTGALQRRG